MNLLNVVLWLESALAATIPFAFWKGPTPTPIVCVNKVLLTNGTTWTIPGGWLTNFQVEMIGAGGAGGVGTSGEGGGGGGGGAYIKIMGASLSGTITYQIGIGGDPTASKRDTCIFNCAIMVAKGGANGTSTAGGAGGSDTASLPSTSSVRYKGGKGAGQGVFWMGGGGGGAGGPTGAGGDGTTGGISTGGAGGAGGGGGGAGGTAGPGSGTGNGGAGGNGSNIDVSLVFGSGGGGGGGGDGAATANGIGGNGGNYGGGGGGGFKTPASAAGNGAIFICNY
ncbi:MAG: hypothetical protein JSU04_11655 [Bdellovibrionales bacterium]|nr:hypothetical protein [Bdellovibrionales bacterium]